MDRKIIIGVSIVAVVLIIIIIMFLKKEKFTLNSGVVTSSGSGTAISPIAYLTTDQNGNISATDNGMVNNLDVEGVITLKGYQGNAGDVLVSNGTSAPPVWAAGVGLSDFTGANQKLDTNGYQILPGGLIIQWGYVPATWGSGDLINFPIPFPNNCFSFTATPYYGPTGSGVPSGNNVVMPYKLTKTSFSFMSPYPEEMYWMAFGN